MAIVSAVAGLQNRSLEKKSVIVSEVEKNVWPTITGVQVFSIDGSSRGSPAHGKQQAYWEDTAYSIILWLWMILCLRGGWHDFKTLNEHLLSDTMCDAQA